MSDPHNPSEEAIFVEALELPTPEARVPYLAQACGSNVALRRRVEALLQAHDHAGKFLDPPCAAASSDKLLTTTHMLPVAEQPGDRIGRYKLLQKIGEGGWGVVYMAEQQEPVKRRVALKVIKPGMDTRQVLARFEAERQALALMDHPNIAKVLDAGATDTGRPFFVMELVRGVKITDYCDDPQNNLSTERRLDLFIQICRAIQHAHQKGIIHRDIKPSNILVTLQEDGTPTPKIIDFGIAKATASRTLTDKTLFTAFEQFIGTPAYVSPEQAQMTAIDIDTRSDIYSLGVLLYELLTGKTPFDSKRLGDAGLDEVRRIINEEEPLSPSTRLSTLNAVEQTTVAKRRQSDPPKLIHRVRGDLDWIVMKCLEKDRNRRYETANGLARDIERHLNNEPIVARPPSSVYRLQKLVRRNRVVFAAATAIAAALVLGLALAIWGLADAERQSRRAEANEKKAQAEAAKSQQVAQFLKNMLDGVGPSKALGRDTTMLREILDKTAERVGQNLSEQPEVGADIQTTIGEVYYALADYPRAETMLRQAVGIRRKLFGNDNLDLAHSLDDLGVTLQKQRKAKEAIRAHREALAIRRKLLGNEHPDVAKSLSHLGEALNTAGKFKEAETTLREAVAMQRKLVGEENPDLALFLRIFANSLKFNHELGESEAAALEALAISRKLYGDDHPEVASSLQVLANSLRAEGKLSEAEDLYRQVLELRMRLLGNGHPFVGESMVQLATLLKQEGKPEEVVSLYRKLADQGNAEAQGRLGWMYAKGTGVATDLVEAVNLCRKAAAAGNANGQLNLGVLYAEGLGVEKDTAQAANWFRKAADQGDSKARNRLDVMYANGEGDPEEAANWYRKAAEHGDAKAQLNLGCMYERGEGVERDPAAADNWFGKAAEAKDPQVLNALAWKLATSPSAKMRDGPHAVAFAEKAVAATNRKDPKLLDTLAAAYAEAGEFTEAVSALKEAIGLLRDEQAKNELATRLELYESNTPYRQGQ